ncbi:MAG: hypothetical protein GY941_19915 [Planctomycetes bacterium]|nr:hypothetical protein [Planctomycetota bacterium]
MNNIKAISYTSVNHAQNNASHQVAKSNPFVITEEYFIATLDAGTTPECRALDGEVYKLNVGPIPPLHMRCRSKRNPYLNVKNFSNRPIKTYTEKILAKEYAKKKGFLGVKTRADIPFGHKKAFDEYARKRARKLAGTVPAKIKYNDFLKMASKDFQDEALGPRRAALFRKGKIHVRDFVNDSGELLTIKDLQATGYDI